MGRLDLSVLGGRLGALLAAVIKTWPLRWSGRPVSPFVGDASIVPVEETDLLPASVSDVGVAYGPLHNRVCNFSVEFVVV